MTARLRRGSPDRSMAGSARGIAFGERARIRRALSMTPAGQDLVSQSTPGDQRDSLGLGDIATDSKGTYALSSHAHDASSVALSNAGWTKALAESGPDTVQGLADWIDQHFPV